MQEQDSLPVMDDQSVDAMNGQSEDALLAAALADSPMLNFGQEESEPLPEEEIPEVDPETESEEVDPEEDEVPVSDEETEEDEDVVEGEDAAEEELEAATEEPEVYTADDLDLDAKVKVKVDGEELDVSFADLLKGYQTDASLSKKGRELGEARKALEAEREEKLAELETIGQAAAATLYETESGFAKEYHDIEKKIEEARKEGDTFEVNELKDKRELVQKKYWDARKKREGIIGTMQQQKAAREEAQMQEQLKNFSETILDYVPDFNEETAGAIREFAISEGVPEEVLAQIVDPRIVKFIDDYRRLKTTAAKGQAKRKAVPAKKAVPTKKMPSAEAKKKAAEAKRQQRALSEDASDDEQMDFLRTYASQSLSKL